MNQTTMTTLLAIEGGKPEISTPPSPMPQR